MQPSCVLNVENVFAAVISRSLALDKKSVTIIS